MTSRRILAAHVFVLLVFLSLWTWKLLQPQPVPEAISARMTSETKFVAAKALHACGYTFLTLLAVTLPLPNYWRWFLAGLLALHGVATEIGQTYVPGRTGRVYDVLIDWAGVALGVLVWRARDALAQINSPTQENDSFGAGASPMDGIAKRPAAHLVVAQTVEGSGLRVGDVIPLTADRVVLGRQDDDPGIYCISHHRVSRKHAEITWSLNGCLIHDLKSRSGTSVNGSPCRPGDDVPLANGDRIEICGFVFVFRTATPAPDVPAEPWAEVGAGKTELLPPEPPADAPTDSD